MVAAAQFLTAQRELRTTRLRALSLVLLSSGLSVDAAALMRKRSQRRGSTAPTDEMGWAEKVTFHHFQQVYAADLGSDNFIPTLRNSTVEYVLLDFYAPWCPHCQHFAPEFERLSLAIQQHNDKRTQPRILSAAVDCVRFAHLCEDWGIKSFPALRWGKRTEVLAGPGPNVKKIEIQPPTAETVAQFINSDAFMDVDPSPVRRSDLNPWLQTANGTSAPHYKMPGDTKTQGAFNMADVWDAQIAAGLFIRFALQENRLVGEAKRTLLDFVSLLGRNFPTRNGASNCRPSFTALYSKLQSHSVERPGHRVDPDSLEKHWSMCQVDWREYGNRGWGQCQGTWAGKRGFTCGLWTLFHMLAAEATDASAAADLRTVREAISQFFSCAPCRDAFLKIPQPIAENMKRRDVQLWLWNAHNVVNRRVQQIEEENQVGDPQFPKSQWPTPQLCPNCRVASSPVFLETEEVTPTEVLTLSDSVAKEHWNLREVGSFLDRYYR